MTSSYLHFPDFDPVIFSVDPSRFTGMAKRCIWWGSVFRVWLAVRRANRPGSGWTKTKLKIYSIRFLGVMMAKAYWL